MTVKELEEIKSHHESILQEHTTILVGQNFIIPNTVLEALEWKCKQFLWGEKHKSKVSWKKLCMPKSNGGLGLNDFITWNQAAMTQRLWDIHTNKDNMWVKWIHVFYLQTDRLWWINPRIPNRWVGYRYSCYFTDICALRDELRTMFQGDFVELRQSLGAWEASGMFIASAYNLMHARQFPQVYDQPNQPRERMFIAIWKRFIPPKFSFNVWIALLGRVHTKDRYREGEDEPTDRICSLCHLEGETNIHILFECEFTRTIWDRVILWIGLRRRTTSIQSSEQWIKRQVRGSKLRKERNSVVMKEKQPSSARAYKFIVDVCYMVLNRIFPEENLY